MLHLAQVVKNGISKKLELNLLAVEESTNQWTFCDKQSVVLSEEYKLTEGLLLLVELNQNKDILHYKNAKDWVLDLVRNYVIDCPVSSKFLLEEEARVEKWRQELTSKSQDLTRMRLEIETRREELQELEYKLSMERDKNN